MVAITCVMVWESVSANAEGPGPEKSRSSGDSEVAPRFEPHHVDALRKLWAGNLEEKSPESPTNRVADNSRAVRLGHALFYEERLSGNGEVSCASCHQPEHAFSGPTKLATQGIGEAPRTTPTLINVGFQQWYFWDGRADSVWSQALGPIEAPAEMGGSRLELAHVIYRDDELRRAYESIEAFDPLPDLSDTDRFPEEGRPVDNPTTEAEKAHAEAWNSMTEADQRRINRVTSNVLKTIAAFELQLTSLETPFDRFVEGLIEDDPEKIRAIGPEAREGAKLFVGRARCTNCHNDPMFSSKAGKFHNLGLEKPEWVDQADLGRWEGLPKWKDDTFNSAGPFSDDPEADVTVLLEVLERRERHKGAMKVPPLRHVAQTGPYMHAGHFETLREVVEFYDDLDQEPAVGHRSKEAVKLDLTEEEIDALVAFLETLGDENAIADKWKRPPESPLPK